MIVPFLLAALLAPIFFPLPYAMGVALIAGVVTPLAPLIAGLLADTLYYSSHVYPVPLYTILGAIASLLAWGVRRFVQTSIMR